MDAIIESLSEAEGKLRTLDHMAYVTFPLIKDKRLLLKIVQDTKEVIAKCITSVLQYEYLCKRVALHKDSWENMRTFTERCCPRYGITRQETDLILKLFDFVEKHRQSPLEFMKNGKVVIVSENSRTVTLTVEMAKEFLLLAKTILKKIMENIEKNMGKNFTSEK